MEGKYMCCGTHVKSEDNFWESVLPSNWMSRLDPWSPMVEEKNQLL